MKVFTRLVCLVIGLLVGGQTIAQQKHQASVRSVYTDQIIVKYALPKAYASFANDRFSVPSIAALQETAGTGLEFRRIASGNDYIYRLAESIPVEDVALIAARLQNRIDIEYAEPDYWRHPFLVPDDTDYASQWYLSETAGGVGAQEAWDTTTGNASTVIAVIDTGITTHSELTGRTVAGYDFITETSTANDGDGRDADPSDTGDAVTLNECQGGNDASNSSWHGTSVAGLIAANTNNAAGMAGLDHAASILPLRALGKCGGRTSDINDAIRWAAGLSVPGVADNTNPADIINLSLGGSGDCLASEQAAIDAAVAAGSVVIAAAGNEAGFVTNSSPANCDSVIAVGATTRQGGETVYTNVGSLVDISAPGGNGSSDNIYTLSNSGVTVPVAEDFTNIAGTSFSTPIVAGGVALMLAVNANLTPSQIELILKGTGRSFPTGTSDGFRDCTYENCGEGILDINQAVAAAAAGQLDITPDSFSFASQTGVKKETVIESEVVTITGVNLITPVTVFDGGEYSIDGGAYTDVWGRIENNQTLRVRATSAAANKTEKVITIFVGAAEVTFTITTKGGGGGGALLWFVCLLSVAGVCSRRWVVRG